MAVDAGKVAVNPRGVFSSSATYERLDVVTYQSNTYVALQTTQGNLPTDTSSWAPWVKLDNASMTVRGLVKVDGTSITADADGTIHGHAAAGVNSFNGREGDVLPELGDYDANQIAYDNSNSDLDSTDVNDAIDELDDEKADNSVIAPVETGSTASQRYEINDHFIKDSAFCTATQVIEAGGTFNLNTNYSKGDIAGNIEDIENGKTSYKTIKTATANQTFKAQLNSLNSYFNNLSTAERLHAALLRNNVFYRCNNTSRGEFGAIGARTSSGTVVGMQFSYFRLDDSNSVYYVMGGTVSGDVVISDSSSSSDSSTISLIVMP